jgi:hypothetical protein
MGRRGLFTGGAWLCAIAAGVLLSKPVAVVLFVIGAVAMLAAWEPVGSRLPTLAVERENGIAVRVRPPRRTGRGRLRREAFALAAEIHSYVQAESPRVADDRDWFETGRAARAAQTDEERGHIFQEHTMRSSERSAQETQELRRRFGGRMQYVMDEFQRRGMLSDRDLLRLGWEMNSSHWIVQAANKIEGLAHRL